MGVGDGKRKRTVNLCGRSSRITYPKRFMDVCKRDRFVLFLSFSICIRLVFKQEGRGHRQIRFAFTKLVRTGQTKITEPKKRWKFCLFKNDMLSIKHIVLFLLTNIFYYPYKLAHVSSLIDNRSKEAHNYGSVWCAKNGIILHYW
jgi:hypothetical protein